MNYTTQMNAARQGIITKEMEAVATYEGIDVKDLMAEVAAGTIVIPANKNHKCLKPFGIGNSLKTKINVNLGTSRDCLNLDVEMEKVNKVLEKSDAEDYKKLLKSHSLIFSGLVENKRDLCMYAIDMHYDIIDRLLKNDNQ